MGFIIVGTLVCVIAFGLFVWRGFKVIKLNPAAVLLILLFVFAVSISLGIFLPTGGYQPKTVVKTEALQPFMNLTTPDANGLLLYVGVNPDNSYTYYAVINSEYSEKYYKSYVPKTIRFGKVSIIEEDNCESPRLIEYSEKPNITFWSFGVWQTRTSYMFYIPKDTVLYRGGAK